jgi:RNA polymerase sigma-70 factor, ECF subfamily
MIQRDPHVSFRGDFALSGAKCLTEHAMKPATSDNVGANQAIPDARLVARAKTGDLAAFEELTTRHERQIYSLAYRILQNPHDAEDVTQQAFLSAVENLAKFREESSFATWLYRIATFAALKVIRKRKGLDTVSLEEATAPREDYDAIPHPEYIADWKQSPEQLVERNETRRLLDDALAQLDEKHRLVFVLRDVEGLSVAETAEALGLTESNVKMRLLRARLQLREELTRTLGDPARRIARGHHHHE